MTWRDGAACRDRTDIDWFPEIGSRAFARRAAYDRNVAEAKKVCASCPVQRECLDEALGHGATDFGVWGGTTERERDQLRRERKVS